MALTQLMAFTSAGILVTSFALLLIVLSFNVAQINSVAVFANAKSVAAAIGTRLVTSPNCFAYQSNINYYYNNSAIQGGPLFSVTDTEPGVVDFNKFVTNNFLSCIQYIYFGGATNVPILPGNLAAFTGVSITLVDTENPIDLGQSGSITLSNYPQLNIGAKFPGLENLVNTASQYMEYAALASSIAASAALGTVTGGVVGLNIIVAIASNQHNSIVPQYSLLSALSAQDTYTESFPVEIEFSNAQGEPLYQDSGVLNVGISYGISS